jgi:hypothetical protein
MILAMKKMPCRVPGKTAARNIPILREIASGRKRPESSGGGT